MWREGGVGGRGGEGGERGGREGRGRRGWGKGVIDRGWVRGEKDEQQSTGGDIKLRTCHR